MKSYKFLILLITIAIGSLWNPTIAGGAKIQKIKYSKFAYYEGQVDNKQPKGNGKLTLMNPTNKNTCVATISGQFDSDKIYNAEIESSLLPSIKVVGIQPVSMEVLGKMGKADGFVFDFSSISFEKESMLYEINQLKLNLSIINNKWIMNTVAPQNIESIVLLVNDLPLPHWISRYWNNPKMIIKEATLNHGKFDIYPSCCFVFNNYAYYTDNDIFLPLPSKLRVDVADNFMNLEDNGFKINKSGNGWSGTRILEDGTIIKGDEDKITISVNGTETPINGEMLTIYGNVYEGTLIDPMQPVNPSLKSFSELKLKSGDFNLNGKTIKYINGETEEIIKRRLQDQDVSDGLISQVISGEITEEEAIAKQKRREEQNKELRDILKSKWDCEQIGFSGPVNGTKDGDQVFQMLFNIDHTYFSGEVMLGLNSKGEGVLVVVATPAEKVYRMSRPRAMQVMDACKKLNKTVNGRWNLDGNDILINGEKVATLSPDGQTAVYTGMLGATMKIIKKL